MIEILHASSILKNGGEIKGIPSSFPITPPIRSRREIKEFPRFSRVIMRIIRRGARAQDRIVCVFTWSLEDFSARGKTSGSRVGMEPWWPFVCATHRCEKEKERKKKYANRAKTPGFSWFRAW